MSNNNLDKIEDHPELKPVTPEEERSILKSYTNVFKKYFVFSGRASRYEYWSFVFVNFFASAAAAVLPLIDILYSVAIVIPTLSLISRRLHDINKSFLHWFVIPHIILYSFLGHILIELNNKQEIEFSKFMLAGMSVITLYLIIFFSFTCKKGNKNANKYGVVPID